jgi:hypothetical protein
MSNIFQEVLTDVSGVEQRLLGPSYPYYKNVKTPGEIGMSSDGNLETTARDVNGLISYVELLVSGGGNASSTGRPLGNKFFLQTGGKCIDPKTNQETDRYIYVNNVPSGNVPFISSGLGVNFSEFKGLIPGTMSNLNVLNPFGIMQSFTSGSKPPCQQITMETIDTNNNISSETHYVTVVDVQNMDPCNFPDKKNPITGNSCKEAFTNQKEIIGSTLPNDSISQIYFAGIALLGVYMFYCIANKHK